MSTDQYMQMIYLVLLGTAIAGSYLVSQRGNMGQTAQYAAIWGLIFVGVVGAYGLWGDISNDMISRQSVVDGERVEVPRSRDGHYYLTLQIDDTPVRFVVDTGASQVVLSAEDARRIGFNPADLNFIGQASTANGIVRTAPVWLEEVALGDIVDLDVPAVVNDGQMDESLLGMTYLGLYDRIEIADGRLVLIR
ncbi:retropepsin-like aspartic protease family protein [Yoonia sp. 2307UL14-13]|uniref:retropepsin-like aspartic protease family protein n=1 Tax=Yoonia sp. 2307UL14-13 TaxID=3126506 RepID=UPI0030A53425